MILGNLNLQDTRKHLLMSNLARMYHHTNVITRSTPLQIQHIVTHLMRLPHFRGDQHDLGLLLSHPNRRNRDLVVRETRHPIIPHPRITLMMTYQWMKTSQKMHYMATILVKSATTQPAGNSGLFSNQLNPELNWMQG